jgi:hypothetical protein
VRRVNEEEMVEVLLGEIPKGEGIEFQNPERIATKARREKATQGVVFLMSLYKAGKGGSEIGKDEGKPCLPKLFREDSLAGQDRFFSHLPQEKAEREAREAQPGGSVASLSQGTTQLLLWDGIRGGEIENPLQVIAFQEEADGADFVPKMNPGQPLIAGAERAPEEKAEGEEESGKSPTTLSEDDSGADDGPADSLGFDPCRRGFPLETDLWKEAPSRRGSLVHLFVSARAIEADGRGLDHYPGLLLSLGNGFHDGPAGVQTAGEDTVLFLLGPAARGEVFSGEIDDGVVSPRVVQPAFRAASVPGCDHNPATEKVLGPFRIPGQGHHGMSLLQKLMTKGFADEPSAA